MGIAWDFKTSEILHHLRLVVYPLESMLCKSTLYIIQPTVGTALSTWIMSPMRCFGIMASNHPQLFVQHMSISSLAFKCFFIPCLKQEVKQKHPLDLHPRNFSPWKMMVGRWVSFWDCLFLGAILNYRGVILKTSHHVLEYWRSQVATPSTPLQHLPKMDPF